LKELPAGGIGVREQAQYQAKRQHKETLRKRLIELGELDNE
jgi:hypothetical protein